MEFTFETKKISGIYWFDCEVLVTGKTLFDE